MPETFGKRQRRDARTRKIAAKEERRVARTQRRELRAAGVDVRLFRAPGGGCVRQDQLREFRCTPQDDPVIEAGGLRFLGGTFAMPVSQVSVDARLLGRNSLEEVDIRPGDRPTLFVTT